MTMAQERPDYCMSSAWTHRTTQPLVEFWELVPSREPPKGADLDGIAAVPAFPRDGLDAGALPKLRPA
jgi:hypothetical protein